MTTKPPYPEPVRCFWIEPTDQKRISLRRYRSRAAIESKTCAVNPMGYCSTSVKLGMKILGSADPKAIGEFLDDPRWPGACVCGYQYTDGDARQVNHDTIYIDKKTGAEHLLCEPIPGMMYDASWFPNSLKGSDGRSVVVITPDRWWWQIDGPCSNCTAPGTEHKCWCRHGEPPVITVDKSCNTCKAGAGSIATPNWHGFLTNGVLSIHR